MISMSQDQRSKINYRRAFHARGSLSSWFAAEPPADLLREHRGDSHLISWAVGGADAVEVLLLTEQWWGLPGPCLHPDPRLDATPIWMPVLPGSSAAD